MERLLPLGTILVFLGFILVVAGSLSSPNASVGGVVFIGPIPIIFGSGPYGSQLAAISLLASIAIIVFLFLWTYGRRLSRPPS